MTELQAAIRATRVRLATRITRTADHIETLLTSPAAAQAEPRGGGPVGFAIRIAAAIGRARRSWTRVKRTGLLRRSAMAAGVVVGAAVLAARIRRR
jgi:hypothetical protein